MSAVMQTAEPWIDVLREAVVAQGASKVAARLGYSASVISEVLSGKYKGRIDRVRTAVEGALMQSTVDCPVIGEIPRQKCIQHQRAGFRATNPIAVQLWNTCPDCPHNLSAVRAEGA